MRQGGIEVVDERLCPSIGRVFRKHGLVACANARAHLALAHKRTHKLGLLRQMLLYTLNNLIKVFLASAKTTGTKKEDALSVHALEQLGHALGTRALIAPKTNAHGVRRKGSTDSIFKLGDIRGVGQLDIANRRRP